MAPSLPCTGKRFNIESLPTKQNRAPQDEVDVDEVEDCT